MIESTMKEGVAVLAMRHGKANALDIELCQALCGALDDAAADGAAAVVLTGARLRHSPRTGINLGNRVGRARGRPADCSYADELRSGTDRVGAVGSDGPR
ncbi:hypothetical protein EAS64_38020 [Trebonia kvetii]|uniref:Enoyl-CoA hydratase/isomerase family protein n=1 Tax=Trebonia kvetii TaxID=2480626 RepID=A0A6P2BQF3_9ACTN|nr:hypothetical protein [Trebonia kvetii]TVZ00426.1 hypothetical protein EAS64_38020 [Trebonia kvetii]